MRILALMVGGVVVVIAVILLLFPLARRGNPKMNPEGGVAVEESLDRLRDELRNAKRRIKELDARVRSAEEAVVAINERLDEVEKRSGDSVDSTTDSDVSGDEDTSGYRKVATVESGDVERLRELVRKEMKRVEDSRRRRWRRGDAEQPDEWEKEAFGNYAWYIHRRGKELDLTDTQKRQYYLIIKDYYDKVTELWEKIRNENPNADWREIQRIYEEHSTEMLKETRELVMRILDSEQQKKYRKMFQDDKWYR